MPPMPYANKLSYIDIQEKTKGGKVGWKINKYVIISVTRHGLGLIFMPHTILAPSVKLHFASKIQLYTVDKKLLN